LAPNKILGWLRHCTHPQSWNRSRDCSNWRKPLVNSAHWAGYRRHLRRLVRCYMCFANEHALEKNFTRLALIEITARAVEVW